LGGILGLGISALSFCETGRATFGPTKTKRQKAWKPKMKPISFFRSHGTIYTLSTSTNGVCKLGRAPNPPSFLLPREGEPVRGAAKSKSCLFVFGLKKQAQEAR